MLYYLLALLYVMGASAHALVSPSSSTQTFALFDSQWSVRSEPKFSAEWSAVTMAARLANVYLYYRYNTGVPRTGCQRAGNLGGKERLTTLAPRVVGCNGNHWGRTQAHPGPPRTTGNMQISTRTTSSPARTTQGPPGP